MSAAQLKTMQEVITLVVFVVFATWYLREPLRWNVVAGFVLIAAGAALVYGPWSPGVDRRGPDPIGSVETLASPGTGVAPILDVIE
jgi:drug/metabolite transporter (DMT)-like permease